MTSNPLRHPHWVLPLVVTLGLTAGCHRGGDDKPSATAVAHHGPHGGHTAQMSEGAGFEVEFTLDEKKRRMVVYVQEPGGSRPHPLTADSLSGRFESDGQSVDVTFAADPRPEDPEGHASRFTFPLDKLPQQLLASNDFELRLSYEVDGAAVTASIPHEGNHGHEYNHD